MSAVFSIRQQPEVLSLAPVKVTFNEEPKEYSRNKLAMDFVRNLFQPTHLIKYLYTEQEKHYIKSKISKVDTSDKYVCNLLTKFSSNRLQVLEELNFIIVNNDLQKVVQLFAKTHVSRVAMGWLSQCEGEIEKAFVLNIICVCSKYLSENAAYISSEIITSMIHLPRNLIRKHLIAIICLIYHNYTSSDENNLAYTMKPFAPTNPQMNMINLDYLVFDPPPKALDVTNELQRKYATSQEYIDYLNGKPMDEESHNKKARTFLIQNVSLFPQFFDMLVKALPVCSRFINPDAKIVPIFPSKDLDINNNDFLCDITTLSIWTCIHVIHQYLLSSNIFDAEIFNYFMAKYNFTPYLLQSIHNINQFFFDTELELMLNEPCVSIAIATVTNLLMNSPSRISQYITESTLSSMIKSIEPLNMPSLNAAAAKFIAVCLYWMPREQTGPTPAGPNLTLVNFVYNYLEQFEYYQRYMCDKGSIPPVLDAQTYSSALLAYATKLNLKINDLW